MVQDPTGLSPSMALPSSRLGPRPPQKTLLETTIRLGNLGDFKFELFPLHSPLLRESLLVSFPPLIDMLKFSGSSCLIWDQSIRCTTYCIETSNHSQASTGTVSVYRSPGMFRYEPYTRGYLIGIAKRFGMNSFKFRDSIFRTLRKGNKYPINLRRLSKSTVLLERRPFKHASSDHWISAHPIIFFFSLKKKKKIAGNGQIHLPFLIEIRSSLWEM